MICSNRAISPCLTRALSGNTADKKSFRKTVKKVPQRLKEKGGAPYIVMDSAFFSRKNITSCPIHVSLRKGRPREDTKPDSLQWYITGDLEEDRDAIDRALKTKGTFIVATNELDRGALSAAELLSVYKDQGASVERGFHFLKKDPCFSPKVCMLKNRNGLWLW